VILRRVEKMIGSQLEKHEDEKTRNDGS
jgi:hypothetical protein